MKILFAASEASPFAKTGGLADVAGSLPAAIASLGHDVRLVVPRYRTIDPARYGLRRAATFFAPIASWKDRCEVFAGGAGKGVTAYFLDKPVYFDRPNLYRTAHTDYSDNAERFTFFSSAVLELCRAVGFRPDIIHCNDWQTGLVPLFLKKTYGGEKALAGARTVFTVHNLGYQGLFPQWDMRLLGVGWDVFTPEGIEFWGNINFLKAGLVYSDVITTVSGAYAREIQTPEYGHGLDGLLRKRVRDLYGIVNGIDYKEWNPARDKAIARTFSAARPEGKKACKKALQKKTGLPVSDAPLAGMVTRLSVQKGLDILIDALPEIMAEGAQLVILGSGEERYHRLLSEAAGMYRNRIRVLLRYDDKLAKDIYAGCDIFMMPSRYEPCGLGQMIALRHGTAPVVRKTGGLADTVEDYDEKSGRGTGFVFEEYSAAAFAACLKRAFSVHRDGKKWIRLMQNCMKQDFSWEHSAKEYVKLYRKAREKR